jgi:TolA-binding protein
MKTRHFLVLAVVLAVALPLGAQDWKGRGRLVGMVTNVEGTPLEGVEVRLDNPDRGGGTTVTTDEDGKWGLGGIVAGTWNIDFTFEGYLPKAISVSLPSETTRLPRIKTELEVAGPKGATLETVQALDGAEAAYKKGRYAEARTEFQKLLPELPDYAVTIHQRIGLCYIGEKEYAKALDELDIVLAAEPDNHQIRAIAAQAALEGQLLDRGREYLAALDNAQIGNADTLFNIGVNFLNAGHIEDSMEWFGRTIETDPGYVDAYYRRALGYLGQGKNAEARADFEKVLELDPNGTMADNARKVLEQATGQAEAEPPQ